MSNAGSYQRGGAPGGRAPTIAVAGGKGGCGKTTTTLAVARALVARGVPARAVDLDVGMPNLHRLAGVERDPTLAALVASDERATDERVVDERAAGERAASTGSADERSAGQSTEREAPRRDDCGAEIVPAPRVTADVEPVDALAGLPDDRAVTLLDCPASAGPDATAPLRSADAVLLVSTHRPESVEDAAKTGRMARSLDVPVVGAVVTRADALPERARSRLPTDHVVPIPAVDDPLDDRTARQRYDLVAEWLEPGTRRRGRAQRRGRERWRGRAQRHGAPSAARAAGDSRTSSAIGTAERARATDGARSGAGSSARSGPASGARSGAGSDARSGVRQRGRAHRR